MDELLDDIITDERPDYEIADKGLRFANYMVDYVVITIISIIVMVPIVLMMGGFDDFRQTDGISTRLLDYVIGAFITIFYYIISEYNFKGRTFGKFVTKTRAVTLDNGQMDLGTVVKRSLSRIVPFEAFSFLGNLPTGWHDRWTDTKVIKENGWTEQF